VVLGSFASPQMALALPGLRPVGSRLLDTAVPSAEVDIPYHRRRRPSKPPHSTVVVPSMATLIPVTTGRRACVIVACTELRYRSD
jgi:hypothetical protein